MSSKSLVQSHVPRMPPHNLISAEMLIHFEGEVAREIGIPRRANPYLVQSSEQRAWWAGWDGFSDDGDEDISRVA